MREKLIELIGQVQDDGCDYRNCFGAWGRPDHIENSVLADHLIANGVAIPIRCKDCRYCDPEWNYCDHPMSTSIPIPRKHDDFCSYGERK